MTYKLVVSDICSAFDEKAIGTKVTDPHLFFQIAALAISNYDFEKCRVPGQGFLPLDISAESGEPFRWVSAGVGKRRSNPEDYVTRAHRGIVSAYLKREFAEPVTGCALVVYTKQAYLRDPDVAPAEAERVASATHVLVAVLGFAGPQSPLPPYRLVWNLAGGNLEAALWSAEEIHAKAKAAIEYDNQWSTVAD